MFDKNQFALNPVHFFAIGCDCLALASAGESASLITHQLPLTTALTNESSFACVAMGWHLEGFSVRVEISQKATHSTYPDIEKGDSVELFFDTRNVKTSGYNTRFCHHFFFLPEGVDGIFKGEKTHFRTEDNHPLCDPNLLECQVQSTKKGYQMKIFIPSQCLVGYDPGQFDRLGFTYRINRFGNQPQHFSVVSSDYQLEQQPSLWGSLKLIT